LNSCPNLADCSRRFKYRDIVSRGSESDGSTQACQTGSNDDNL
jgi:hypothetical protein